MTFDDDGSETKRADPEEESYLVSYEKQGDPPSRALVDAIATIEEIDPIALEPLGDVIDTSALDAAMRSSSTDCEMTLTYQRYRVTIRSGGHIELQRTDPDRPG